MNINVLVIFVAVKNTQAKPYGLKVCFGNTFSEKED